MPDTWGHGTGGGYNGSKGPGYEYWSGRPGPIDPGKSTKRITHRMERRRYQAVIEQELVNDGYEC